jgi:hypothetical protein
MISLDFDDFVEELFECGWRPKHPDARERLKAFWQSHQPDGYDASTIKILSPDEVAEKFEWAKAGELAHKYKRDVNWIESGLEACRRAGISQDYFIGRYLEKDETIPKNTMVEQAYRDLRDGVV